MNMMSAITAEGGCEAEEGHRLGELLWSAVWHGGMLAEQDWARCARGLRDGVTICGTLVSIELAAVTDSSSAGRWSADPVTAILILRWRRDGLTVPEALNAKHCLAGFLASRGERIDAFVRQCHDAWEFRLSDLMMAQTRGELPTKAIPRSTWERVVYGPSVPDEPLPRAPKAPLADPTLLSRMLAAEIWELGDARRSWRYTKGKRAAVTAKTSAVLALEALPATANPVRAALRGWAVHALRSERGGRVSIGYSPSTVSTYLKALATVLDGWPSCPLRCPSFELEGHVRQVVARLDGRERSNAIKGLLAFERYANVERQGPLDFGFEEFVIEQKVSADLILPAAYSRAMVELMRRGDDDLADVLTLMYRAGLRLPEVLALRAGDMASVATGSS